MKRSVLPVLMGFALLLLSSTEGWSLPPCKGSPPTSFGTAGLWTDCFGTFTGANGNKYVGEWHDKALNTMPTEVSEQEGIFENNNFLYAKRLSPTVTAKKAPTKRSSLPPCPCLLPSFHSPTYLDPWAVLAVPKQSVNSL